MFVFEFYLLTVLLFRRCRSSSSHEISEWLSTRFCAAYVIDFVRDRIVVRNAVSAAPFQKRRIYVNDNLKSVSTSTRTGNQHPAKPARGRYRLSARQLRMALRRGRRNPSPYLQLDHSGIPLANM